MAGGGQPFHRNRVHGEQAAAGAERVLMGEAVLREAADAEGQAECQ